MFHTVPTADHSIERAYQQAIRSLPPSARVARSAAMFQWAREQLTRQIVGERGPLDSESLKWLVALRMYGNEPGVRELIERRLSNVSS